MTELLLVILILLVLGVLVFLVVLAKRRSGGDAGDVAELRGRLEAEQAARVQAETRLEAERKNLAEQRALLDEAEGKLKDAFKALSADALKESRQEFLGQAGERLKPIQDLLAKYENRLAEVEKSGMGAYSGLREYLDGLMRAQDSLRTQTTRLETALRGSPTARGRWGEMTLRRVVEVAGMSPHCDFTEQADVQTDEGRQRPDMIIHLPGERSIVVDSKVPLTAYMDAVEAPEGPGRTSALGRHAQDVRKHVRALGQKAYWDQFAEAPDFVVLFLPGESFFSAALEADRTLMEDAMRSRVFLATPTTLMALLNVVAHGWRQQEMAENAEAIGETGRELFERVSKLVEHFGKIGDGLNRAAKAYDAALGSYESRVRPSAERLAQQSAALEKELPAPEPAQGPVRALPEGET